MGIDFLAEPDRVHIGGLRTVHSLQFDSPTECWDMMTSLSRRLNLNFEELERQFLPRVSPETWAYWAQRGYRNADLDPFAIESLNLLCNIVNLVTIGKEKS